MLRISFSPPRSSFYSFKTRRNYRLELGMGSCSNMDICGVNATYYNCCGNTCRFGQQRLTEE